MNLWGPIAATDCLTSTLVVIECDAVCTKFKQILVLAFINTVCYMTPGVSKLKYCAGSLFILFMVNNLQDNHDWRRASFRDTSRGHVIGGPMQSRQLITKYSA